MILCTQKACYCMDSIECHYEYMVDKLPVGDEEE